MIEPLSIQVRFSDIDAMGHVNNAVYLSYFELARVYYFEKIMNESWDWKKNGIILVKNEIEYLKPLYLKSKPMVSMTLNEIGNKSFKLNYIIKDNSDFVCQGTSTLVYFDFSRNRSIILNEKIKSVLKKLAI